MPYIVPDNYELKKCYLCSGIYNTYYTSRHYLHYQPMLFKHTLDDDLYSCDICVYTNWHKPQEWIPYYKYYEDVLISDEELLTSDEDLPKSNEDE